MKSLNLKAKRNEEFGIKKREWYFSVVDIVAVLANSAKPKRYWSDLKIKLRAEGSQLYEKIVQLKMISSNILFPRNCIFCNKKGVNICDDCFKTKFVKAVRVCHVCGRSVHKRGLFVHSDCKKSTFLDGIVSCFQYNKYAKEVIRLIKYDGYHDILNDVARSAMETFPNLPFSYDFLIPVPIHKTKLRDRGFNQAEILAKKLTWNYKNLLVRNRATKPQAGLDKEERIGNVENAFELLSKIIVKGKSVLLIDDVYTTGATLENCAKVLLESGVNKVWGFTWAKD